MVEVAGRPTKLTPAIQEVIAAHVRDAQTLQTAATLAGIHRDTFHEWRRRGEAVAVRDAAGDALTESEVAFLEFHRAIETARAEAQAAAVVEVRAAGRAGNWQASRWYLERSFPDEWGPKSPAAVAVSASQSSLSEAIKRGRAALEASEAYAAATDADAAGDSANAEEAGSS